MEILIYKNFKIEKRKNNLIDAPYIEIYFNSLLRNSKKVIINQKAFVYQRPDNLLNNFSALTQLVTKNLHSKHKVNRFSTKDISVLIRANFTHYWNTVLDYQLKYIRTFLPVLKSYDSTLIYACLLYTSPSPRDRG